MAARKFKPGDKCRIKKLMGESDDCLPCSSFRVGSRVVIINYDPDNRWHYYARGMGPNASERDNFKTAELELIKRKG